MGLLLINIREVKYFRPKIKLLWKKKFYSQNINTLLLSLSLHSHRKLKEIYCLLYYEEIKYLQHSNLKFVLFLLKMVIYKLNGETLLTSIFIYPIFNFQMRLKVCMLKFVC